jgi:hypothetical protein
MMKGVDPIRAVIGQDVLRCHRAVIDYATLALFLKEEHWKLIVSLDQRREQASEHAWPGRLARLDKLRPPRSTSRVSTPVSAQ